MTDHSVEIEFYKSLWDLENIKKYQETHSSFLYEVSYKKTPSLLKIFKEHSDEKSQGYIMKQCLQHISPIIYQTSHRAILQKKILPGSTLVETALKDDVEATIIFCQILKKLFSATISANIIGEIQDVTSLGEVLTSGRAYNSLHITTYMVSLAEEIFYYLVSSQNKKLLLHGDLHHYNILFSKQDGWLIIDPKGYLGEAEFEIGAFLRNPIFDEPQFYKKNLFEKRLQTISEKLKLDKRRIILWSFVQTVSAIANAQRNPIMCNRWKLFAEMLFRDIRRWWR